MKSDPKHSGKPARNIDFGLENDAVKQMKSPLQRSELYSKKFEYKDGVLKKDQKVSPINADGKSKEENNR